MAERFTKEQNLVADCMKYLIRLYYLDKARPDGEIWHYGEISDTLMKLIERLYRGREIKNCNWTMSRTQEGVLFTYRDSLGLLAYDCVIPLSYWNTFINIMDLFATAIGEQHKTFFMVHSFFYEFDTGILGHSEFDEGAYRYCGHLSAPSGSVIDDTNYGQSTSRFFSKSRSINKAISYVARTGEECIYRIDDNNVILITPKRFMSLFGNLNTDFANKVVNVTGDNRIHFPMLQSVLEPSLAFNDFLQSLFIGFELAFHGYDRIKSCPICKKIFFEKKKGSGLYCSTKCRLDFNRASEPRQKRLCRDSNNHWLNYYYDWTDWEPILKKVYKLNKVPIMSPVHKDDCIQCDLCVPKGECSILCKNNKKMVTVFKDKEIMTEIKQTKTALKEKRINKRISQAE